MKTAHHSFSISRFAFQWAIVTGLGWLVSLLVLSTQSVVIDDGTLDGPDIIAEGAVLVTLIMLVGFITALFQGGLLNRYIVGAHWWIVASTIGVIPVVILMTTDYPNSWMQYPIFTAFPVGLAQGLVLLWLSTRLVDYRLSTAFLAAIVWGLLRPAILIVLMIFPGIKSVESSGDTAISWVIPIVLFIGLPFGFLAGLSLARIIKSTGLLRT